MRRQRNIFQIEEQDITSEKELNELEINNLPDEEFKVMTINMVNKLRRRMDEHSENVNKLLLYNIKKNQTELKSTINEIRNTLGGINSRLDDTEK